MEYVQPSLIESVTQSSNIENAIKFLAEADADIARLGTVFTRREVVEFMLDVAGYTIEKDLARYSLLEPSFGQGDFLLPIVERLLESYFLHNEGINDPYLSLKNAIRAVEINTKAFGIAKNNIFDLLKQNGIGNEDAKNLVATWLINKDFLLNDFALQFSFAVGNPPYVRQELLADVLIAEYRKRYKTIYDRADLYIPFIEHSLSLLDKTGKLVFICPDRWLKNRYGKLLRKFISSYFHLQGYINMNDVDAFHRNVIAYPAIFAITSQKNPATYIVKKPQITNQTLKNISSAIISHTQNSPLTSVQVLKDVTINSQPWIFHLSIEEQKLLQRLEQSFPLLEETGCKVGIGVATGCDKVFIAHAKELPIEESRKLPLLTTRDIRTGKIKWSGKVIVNPFDTDGNLVNLENYPDMKSYFLANEALVRRRHIAQRKPKEWYRTIDKISMSLKSQPKLLIPDIKGEPLVVYDDGNYYPHHNLYYVISFKWDLFALKAILQSTLANFFIATYSVQMRGGYFRFQAQNIRRIRIPQWENIPETLKSRLIQAGKDSDITACNEIMFDLYGFSQEEKQILDDIL